MENTPHNKGKKIWTYTFLFLLLTLCIFLIALPFILHPQHRDIDDWIRFEWPYFLAGICCGALALMILGRMG
jgi:hypothetical protein